MDYLVSNNFLFVVIAFRCVHNNIMKNLCNYFFKLFLIILKPITKLTHHFFYYQSFNLQFFIKHFRYTAIYSLATIATYKSNATYKLFNYAQFLNMANSPYLKHQLITAYANSVISLVLSISINII